MEETEVDVRSTAIARIRGVRRTAVAGGVLLATGVLASAAGVAAGASGASPSQSARAALGYTCQFPSGSYPVGVVIAATFPTAAAAGQQIHPTGLQITARLPHPAIAYLTKQGGATARVSDTLTVAVTGHAKPTTARWHASTTAAQGLPLTGSVSLAATGTPAPMTMPGTGNVTLSAGDLALAVALRKPDGAATSPAVVHVVCTPGQGARARLASIAVRAASAPKRPPAQSGQRPARHRSKLPPGCGHIKAIPPGVATCGYITGYADVAKLYGAALLQPGRPAPPGLVNVDFAYRIKFSHGLLIAYSSAELYYHGRRELPPLQATFLAFGFVPVRATLHIKELTPIAIVSASGVTAPPYPISVRAATKVSVRLSNVRVNGQPLNVGPHCQTARPVTLVLTGKGFNTLPPTGYTVPTGGPLAGSIKITPFTGCGVTENLDRLLTGTISGPGNYLKMTQGPLCAPSQQANWTCPPPRPKPIR